LPVDEGYAEAVLAEFAREGYHSNRKPPLASITGAE